MTLYKNPSNSLLEIMLMISLEGQKKKQHKISETRGCFAEFRQAPVKVIYHLASFSRPEELINNSEPELSRILRTATSPE